MNEGIYLQVFRSFYAYKYLCLLKSELTLNNWFEHVFAENLAFEKVTFYEFFAI